MNTLQLPPKEPESYTGRSQKTIVSSITPVRLFVILALGIMIFGYVGLQHSLLQETVDNVHTLTESNSVLESKVTAQHQKLKTLLEIVEIAEDNIKDLERVAKFKQPSNSNIESEVLTRLNEHDAVIQRLKTDSDTLLHLEVAIRGVQKYILSDIIAKNSKVTATPKPLKE